MFSPVECSTRKRAYERQEDAEEALVQSRIQMGNHGARNIYLCDKCSYWHLTSKGELHPIISKRSKDIELARTAEQWKGRNR